MLEQINHQLENPLYLNANSNYLGLKRDLWPKLSSDLYPLAGEYYHDLNPFFSFNILNYEFFSTFPVVTLRDGFYSTAVFYSLQFAKLLKNKQTLLVHKKNEAIVPDQLKNKSFSYKMVQPKRIHISVAKQVILIGVVSDQILENYEQILAKLEILKEISPQTKVKIYFQTRKNPFEQNYSEHLITTPFMYQLFKKIKSDPQFITTSELVQLGFLKETYVINLMNDTFFIADSYIDYLLSSKGATIHEWDAPSIKAPLKTHPISLFHQIEINEIKSQTIFSDLIFIKKRSYAAETLYDPFFFTQVKNLFEHLKK